jgi:hypothetical protein
MDILKNVVLLSVVLIFVTTSGVAFAQEQIHSSFTGIKVSNSQILTTYGEKIEEVRANHMIQIGSDISNLRDISNSFAYQVVIINENGTPVSKPQWITGLLFPGQSLSSALSWIPYKPGNYEAIISVGNSPNVLSQVDKISFKVLEDFANGNCSAGLEKIYKVTDGSALCVKPATADKLVERGYATRR